MKKVKLYFCIFCFILLGIFGCSALLKKEYSFSLLDKENKNKLEVSLENSVGNTFLLKQKNRLERMLGKKEKNEVYFGLNNTLLEKTNLIRHKKELIDMLNSLYQNYNTINMSLILLPSHITVEPKLVKGINNLQYDEIKEIYKKIYFNTIDVVPVLQKKDYETFYKTDSHITSYGAYFIYQKYMELNDLSYLSIDDFEIEKVSDHFLGNLYHQTNSFSSDKERIVKFVPKKKSEIKVLDSKQKETSLYREEYLNTENEYRYFLGVNSSILITNNPTQKGEILIVKDWGANPIIPFFTLHYKNVHIIDYNSFDKGIDEYLKNHPEIKDVVFIFSSNQIDFEF